MTRRITMAIGATVLVAGVVGGGVTMAVAQGDDDAQDTSITGDELTRATAAALTEAGQGRVTDTEVGDEESFYEVEVTLDDGSQVDVQLDRQFQVVSISTDHEDGPDGD